MRWPSGAPSATVIGELGWWPAEVLTLESSLSLLARLCAAPSMRSSSRVLVHALECPGSATSSWLRAALSAGLPSPQSYGVHSGCSLALVHSWRSRGLSPSLQDLAVRRYRAELNCIDSLSQYSSWQAVPFLNRCVYSASVDPDDARIWGLARCGHHRLAGGRISRHRNAAVLPCPCGLAALSLEHILLLCPLMSHLRASCYRNLPQPSSLGHIFASSHAYATLRYTAAGVRFVASVSHALRDLGLVF